MPDGKIIPDIVWNGNTISNPALLQKIFEEQMPQARHEVQGYDCQVLNPHYNPEGIQGQTSASGRDISILLTVTGMVKYGEPKAAEPQGFSENFVLIPDLSVGSGRPKWLIQSQNFRLVA